MPVAGFFICQTPSGLFVPRTLRQRLELVAPGVDHIERVDRFFAPRFGRAGRAVPPCKHGNGPSSSRRRWRTAEHKKVDSSPKQREDGERIDPKPLKTDAALKGETMHRAKPEYHRTGFAIQGANSRPHSHGRCDCADRTFRSKEFQRMSLSAYAISFWMMISFLINCHPGGAYLTINRRAGLNVRNIQQINGKQQRSMNGF